MLVKWASDHDFVTSVSGSVPHLSVMPLISALYSANCTFDCFSNSFIMAIPCVFSFSPNNVFYFMSLYFFHVKTAGIYRFLMFAGKILYKLHFHTMRVAYNSVSGLGQIFYSLIPVINIFMLFYGYFVRSHIVLIHTPLQEHSLTN